MSKGIETKIFAMCVALLILAVLLPASHALDYSKSAVNPVFQASTGSNGITLKPSGVFDWTQFQGSQSHTGKSSWPGPTTNDIAWNASFGVQPIGLLESDNKLIVSLAVGTSYVEALNFSTGKTMFYDYAPVKYNLNAPDIETVYPATGGGLIYYAVYAGLYEGPALVGDHINDGSNSWLSWGIPSGTFGLYGAGMTTYDSGILYYDYTGNHSVYAYNATNRNSQWQSPILSGNATTIPTIGNGLTVVGFSDSNTLVALSSSSGAQTWSFATDGRVFDTPSYDNGTFYFGTSAGTIYAVNSSGKLVWDQTISSGHTIQSTPAVSNGLVFVGSPDGYLYALNATNGSVAWSYWTGASPIVSSPVVSTNGIVYVGSTSGTFYAFNAATGILDWQSSLGGSITTSPALYGGYLFIADSKGVVHAFGGNDFAINATPSTVSLTAGAIGTASIIVTSVDNFTGKVDLTTSVSPSFGLTCNLGLPSVTLGYLGNSIVSCHGSIGTYQVTLIGSNSTVSHTSPVTFIVGKDRPSISTNLSANTIAAGSSVSDSATLAGGFQAGGTVTYNTYGSADCTGLATMVSTVTLSNGVVPGSSSATFNNPGSFSWNAVYSGDANNNGVTSACELLTVISKVSISTSLSLQSIIVGNPVTDSASLSGETTNAGGTVTYNLFPTSDCTGTSTVVSVVTVTNGQVPSSASHTFNSAGSFSWNASYNGDSSNNAATSSCEPLTVIKASTTITTTLSSTSPVAGTNVADSASLAGGFNAGGTVTYTDFTNGVCTGSVTLVSTVPVTAGFIPISREVALNSTGVLSFQAVYSGDHNNVGATSSCEPLTVNGVTVKMTTALSVTTVTVGGSASDSAALQGQTTTASGTVTYTEFANGMCAAPGTVVSTVGVSNGLVPMSTSVTFNASDTFSFQAEYSGDANNMGVTSRCEPIMVAKAIPTISTSLSPTTIIVGSSVIDTSTLSGGYNAGGTVTYEFFTGSTCTGMATTVGTPEAVTDNAVPNSASQTFNSAGSYSWKAAYSGDANNIATSSCATLAVTVRENVPPLILGFDPTLFYEIVGILVVVFIVIVAVVVMATRRRSRAPSIPRQR